MNIRENRWPLLLMAVILAAGVVIGHMLTPQAPGETTYLPGETVTVEVESPQTLAELVATKAYADDLKYENGELRDELGRKVEPVEIIRVVTEPAPPPIETEIYIRETCPDMPGGVYKATFNATKFKGLNDAGELAFGWRGQVTCWLGLDGDVWHVLHTSPLLLSNTEVVTSAPPVAQERPHRWFAGLHFAVLRDSTRLDFDYQVPLSVTPDRIRAYAGIRVFPKKRLTWRAGMWADSSSAGFDLGADW